MSEQRAPGRTTFPDDTTTNEQAALDGHVTSLVPGYALGVLDPHEVELVARHIPSCALCRAELTRFEQVGTLLAYAAPAEPVPLRARATLLATIDGLGSSNGEQMLVLTPAVTPIPWYRRRPRAVTLASVAAALVVVMVGGMLAMGERANQLEQQIEVIEEQKDDAQRQLMADNNPRYMTELVASSAAPDARGRLFIDRELNSAMLLLINLPRPAEGEYYVVWLQFVGTTEYAQAGVLQVDNERRAQLTIEPRDPLTRYDAMIVTVETDASVAAPVGPQLLTAGMGPTS